MSYLSVLMTQLVALIVTDGIDHDVQLHPCSLSNLPPLDPILMALMAEWDKP